MTLHKKTTEAIQPVKTEGDKPFLFEIDMLIFSKLEKAGLSFSDIAEKKDISLENGVEVFQNEVLSRHESTGILFSTYCTKFLFERFLKGMNEKTLQSSSPDFLTITLMTGGFTKASQNYLNTISNKDESHLFDTIVDIFETSEFEKIIGAVKFLLKEFPKQVNDAYKWIIKDAEPKKQQMDAFEGFLNLLKKPGNWDKKRNGDDFKKAAQKVLDVCTPLNGKQDPDHNLWILSQREHVGILSPEKELIRSLDRIMNYLDILHYGFYLTNDLPKNPDDLKFKALHYKHK